MNQQLEKMPRLGLQYLRAALKRQQTAATNSDDTLAALTYSGLTIDASQLKQYQALCGFKDANEVPLTFPAIPTLPLQVELLLSSNFPYSLIGLVHIKNEITQHQPIKISDALDVQCRLSGAQPSHGGEAFDIHIDLFRDGECIWSCTSTYLKRGISNHTAPKPKNEHAGTHFKPKATWQVGGDIGRRYAKLCGDINPIHMYQLTAKLFGFKQAIAHGMWTVGKCLPYFDSELTKENVQLKVEFKSPLYLPSSVEFYCDEDNTKQINFCVQNSHSGKPHVLGSIIKLASK